MLKMNPDGSATVQEDEAISTDAVTDDQLRAAPVTVTGALTDAQLRAAPVAVTGDFASDGLTNTQLRATAVPVNTPDVIVSGTLAAATSASTGIYVSVPLNSYASVAIQTTGTWTGTLTFQASIDGGVTWFAVNAALPNTGGASTTINSNQQAYISTGAFSDFRVNRTTAGTGTVTVVIRASAAYREPSSIAGGLGPAVNIHSLAGSTIGGGNGTSGSGVLRVTVASDSTGQVAAIGKAAAGTTISGAPVLNGGAARTTNPTAVADGQVSNIMTDKVGRLVTVASHIRNLVEVQTTTITSSTTETPIVSAIASTFCDLTALTITNSAATSTLVTLKDSTGGTTRGIYSIAGNGNLNIPFSPPLPQATVNTAWTATCSASVDSIYIQAVYVRNT